MNNIISKNNVRDLYLSMYLIRKVEEILMAEYHPANQMKCPIHFCVGQEAMPAALSKFMRATDTLMTHYRSHGYFLAKGAPLNEMVAEFYGKATGSNHGVAGSMELGSHNFNFFSGAIVGGSLFIPLGNAFSQKYLGQDDISIAVIGDGVFDEGVTYEIFNLATLYNLPLLIICENNGYAAHTSIDKRMLMPNLSQRAHSFGLQTKKLDGNDCIKLFNTLEEIIPQIRAGKGPWFLEIETYRQCAHVGPESDDGIGYRPSHEIDDWKKRDPINFLQNNFSSEEDLKFIREAENEIQQKILLAIEAAKSADFPDFINMLSTNYSNSYSDVIKKFTSNPVNSFYGGQDEALPGPF